MHKQRIAALLILLATTAAASNAKPTVLPSDEVPFAWKDKDGKNIPDSDSRKSKNNFAAQLILTSDADLWKQWYSLPSEVAPKITMLKNPAARNKPIFFALIYANPQKDQDGKANVDASFEVTKPDGKISKVPYSVAYKGKLPGPETSLRLAEPALAYVVENSDPSGTYKVLAKVKDNIRNVEIILNTSFEIK